MQNELRGNISFASWPSKTVWWICAKTRNKSMLFSPCTLQSCLWSHMCSTGHRQKQNSGSFKILLYMAWYETVSFRYLQKVIFSYFLDMLNFSFMPWNLNPRFPLVIPSGLRDSLRDLAQSLGSGSGVPGREGSSFWLVGTRADFAATWHTLASSAAFWSPLTSSLQGLRPFLVHILP